MIEEAQHSALTAATCWALCGGVALYLVAIALIRFVACRDSITWFPWVLFGSLAVTLGLAVAGGLLPPLVLEAILVAMLVGKVCLEILQMKLTEGSKF